MFQPKQQEPFETQPGPKLYAARSSTGRSLVVNSKNWFGQEHTLGSGSRLQPCKPANLSTLLGAHQREAVEPTAAAADLAGREQLRPEPAVLLISAETEGAQREAELPVAAGRAETEVTRENCSVCIQGTETRFLQQGKPSQKNLALTESEECPAVTLQCLHS